MVSASWLGVASGTPATPGTRRRSAATSLISARGLLLWMMLAVTISGTLYPTPNSLDTRS